MSEGARALRHGAGALFHASVAPSLRNWNGKKGTYGVSSFLSLRVDVRLAPRSGGAQCIAAEEISVRIYYLLKRGPYMPSHLLH